MVAMAEANKSFTPSNSLFKRFLAMRFSARKELVEMGTV
jgi:hypothetical protein